LGARTPKGLNSDSQNPGARKPKGLIRIAKIKGSKQDSENLRARKPKSLNRIDLLSYFVYPV
jgi:hypothetical protein